MIEINRKFVVFVTEETEEDGEMGNRREIKVQKGKEGVKKVLFSYVRRFLKSFLSAMLAGHRILD